MRPGTTPTTPTTPTRCRIAAALAQPPAQPLGQDLTEGGQLDVDVRVKENRPSVLFGASASAVRTGARARVEIPLALSGHVLACSRSRTTDREGAGAVLQRVHGGRDHPARGPRPAPHPGGRRAAERCGRSPTRQRPPLPPRAGPLDHMPASGSCGDYVPSGSRYGSQAPPRTSTRRARATPRGAVRGLLPPALADPGLERGDPQTAASTSRRPLRGRGPPPPRLLRRATPPQPYRSRSRSTVSPMDHGDDSGFG